LESAWIPLAHGLFLLKISAIHAVFSEWGGVMQYFAGRGLLSGEGYGGWTAGFWPPLYSLLLGLAGSVGDGFAAGKTLSALASVGLLWVAYHLALLLVRRRAVAIAVQIVLPLTPFFAYESLQVHNHMLDAFLLIAGLFLFLRALESSSSRRWLQAGAVCGLAALTRYTSLPLIVLPFFLFFIWRKGGDAHETGAVAPGTVDIARGMSKDAKAPMRRVFRAGVIFAAAFAVVITPWLVLNTVWNGWPSHTLEYLNICAGIHRYAWHAHSLEMLWRATATLPYENIWDVFTAAPHPYLYNMKWNLVHATPLLMSQVGVLGPLLLPAILLGPWTLARRRWVVVYGIWAVYLLVTSQAYHTEYTFLAWTVVEVIVIVASLRWLVERLEGVLPSLRSRFLWIPLLVAMVLGSLLFNEFKFLRYPEEDHAASLADVREVAEALRQADPHLRDKVIMAIDPARAYYAGSRFLMTPLEYRGSVDGLVRYEGLGPKVRAYAPKVPASMPLDQLCADYLVFTRDDPDRPWWGLREPADFSFLLDPDSERIPEGFTPVYRSTKVVVYRIGRKKTATGIPSGPGGRRTWE